MTAKIQEVHNAQLAIQVYIPSEAYSLLVATELHNFHLLIFENRNTNDWKYQSHVFLLITALPVTSGILKEEYGK